MLLVEESLGLDDGEEEAEGDHGEDGEDGHYVGDE